MSEEPPDQQQPWERRDRKLKKRKDAIKESGAGLKSIILPLLKKKSEKAKKTTHEPSGPAD